MASDGESAGPDPVDDQFRERLEDDEYADRIHVLTGDNHYVNGERKRTGAHLVPKKTALERHPKKFEPVSFEAFGCPMCGQGAGRYPRPFLEREAEENPERVRAVAAISRKFSVDDPHEADLEEIIATLAGDR